MANKNRILTKQSLDYDILYSKAFKTFKPLNTNDTKKQYFEDLICRYVLLALETGLRYSDMITLTLNDFTLKQPVINGKMYQYYEVKMNMQKTSTSVTCKVNYSLFEAIKQNANKWGLIELFKTNSKSGYIPLATLNRHLKAFYNIDDISSHTLRKTAGYHIYKASNNIAYAKQLLGHKNLKSTLHYLSPEQSEYEDFYLNNILK